MKATAAVFVLVLAASFNTLGVQGAHAGDEVGPNASCDELWAARNAIYKSKGYCFKTKRARERFGNGGCTIDDIEALNAQLSEGDHRYIKTIKQLEIKNSCGSS